MNEYRFDGLDAVSDQDGNIIYDDVTQRTGDIIADLLNSAEETDAYLRAVKAERDDLAAKLAAAYAELHELRIKAGVKP